MAKAVPAQPSNPSREYIRLGGRVVAIENPPPPGVATPTFDQTAGTYHSSMTVNISTVTAGAIIRYTLDGTTPSETNGTVGNAATVSSTETLQAIAYKTGMADSGIASATYTITEAVSQPSTPSGPGAVATGASATYSTGGSTSSFGNPVQYQFDWGDGSNSGWLPTGTVSASHSWSSGTSFAVTAQARSATNPSVLSAVSSALNVAVGEFVSQPTIPAGPSTVVGGTLGTYSTGGSTDNLGNAVQYLFTWGDGSSSGWLPVGTTSASYNWPSKGTFAVTAQARSAFNPSVLSTVSSALSVTTTEAVSQPSTPSGPATVTAGAPATYSTGGSTDNFGFPIQYLFNWGDGSNSGWLTTGTVSASHSWSSGTSFAVTAQARSATNPTILSILSSSLNVTIAEAVSPPSIPSGPTPVAVGGTATYSTGGSVDNLGNPVQYIFYWGNGSNSGWLPVGTASFTFPSGGNYSVTAQARSATNPSAVSAVSSRLIVVVPYAFISISNQSFQDTDPFLVTVSTNLVNAPFQFCANQNGAFWGCLNYTTDSGGNWSQSGYFNPSTDGSWQEWVVFNPASGMVQSNTISFTVSAPPPYANLNMGTSFQSTDSYYMWMYSNQLNQPFSLCAYKNGSFWGCMDGFTMPSSGYWYLTGPFDSGAIGSWEEYVQFANGVLSNAVFFTVSP